MSEAAGRRSLLRGRAAHQHHRVTFVELFFDLVFVFAITQLSHRLLAHFTPLAALETALLLLAVWWVWVNTSWATNWLDPDRTPVRLLLFAMMIAGLALSTSLPEAFGPRGLVFACAYAAMQVGRTGFVLWAIPADDRALRRNFIRIFVWQAVAALFWILGGLTEGPARLAWWMVALGIEYLAPAVRFWIPVLGASSVRDWTVEGGHMAERCGLFVIIALGESILVTGATFADADWSAASAAAFLVAVLGSFATWWIYFDTGAEAGTERIVGAADPGRIARLAYTYLHLPMIAGIVLSAVADELVLAHPGGHTDAKTALSVIGGPLLFLVGAVAFKHAIRGWFQLSHLAGIAALLLAAPLALVLPPLALATLVTAILLVVAAWESISLSPRRT